MSKRKRQAEVASSEAPRTSLGFEYASKTYAENHENFDEFVSYVEGFGAVYPLSKTALRKTMEARQTRKQLALNNKKYMEGDSVAIRNVPVPLRDILGLVFADGRVGAAEDGGKRGRRRKVGTTLIGLNNSSQRQMIGEGAFAESYLITMVRMPDVGLNFSDPFSFTNFVGSRSIGDVVQDRSRFDDETLRRVVKWDPMFTGEATMACPAESNLALRQTGGFHRLCYLVLYVTGGLPLPPRVVESLGVDPKGKAVFARPPITLQDDELEAQYATKSISALLSTESTIVDKLIEMLASLSAASETLELQASDGSKCRYLIQNPSSLFSATSSQLPIVYLKPSLANHLVDLIKVRVVTASVESDEEARNFNDLVQGLTTVRHETANSEMYYFMHRCGLGMHMNALDGDIFDVFRAILFRKEGVRIRGGEPVLFDDDHTRFDGFSVAGGSVSPSSFDAMATACVSMMFLLSQRRWMTRAYPADDKPERSLEHSFLAKLSGMEGANPASCGLKSAVMGTECDREEVQSFVRAVLNALALDDACEKKLADVLGHDDRPVPVDFFAAMISFLVKHNTSLREQPFLQDLVLFVSRKGNSPSTERPFATNSGFLYEDWKDTKRMTAGSWMMRMEDLMITTKGVDAKLTWRAGVSAELKGRLLEGSKRLLNTKRPPTPAKSDASWPAVLASVWKDLARSSEPALRGAAETFDFWRKQQSKQQFTLDIDQLRDILVWLTELEPADEEASAFRHEVGFTYYQGLFGKLNEGSPVHTAFTETRGSRAFYDRCVEKGFTKKTIQDARRQHADGKRRRDAEDVVDVRAATASLGSHMPTALPTGLISKAERHEQKRLCEESQEEEGGAVRVTASLKVPITTID